MPARYRLKKLPRANDSLLFFAINPLLTQPNILLNTNASQIPLLFFIHLFRIFCDTINWSDEVDTQHQLNLAQDLIYQTIRAVNTNFA